VRFTPPVFGSSDEAWEFCDWCQDHGVNRPDTIPTDELRNLHDRWLQQREAIERARTR
jgi:hypothetical protein